jgi:hypothetical protein
MIAYHGLVQEKRTILRKLRAHAKADRLVKGRYWEDGKGCAVGCTLEDATGSHYLYESRFGIPQALARLEDTIFEGLPNAKAMTWPVAFMSAVPVGADLSRVVWQFLHWLLTDVRASPGIEHPTVKDAVARCAELMSRLALGGYVSWEETRLAYAAAESAAESAAGAGAAAESAAYAADSARSAGASAYSAEAAAESAEAAAESAAESAWSAGAAAGASAYSAGAAYAADSARSAGAAAAYVLMSEKLIQILKETK